jgi:acylphosphatase
MATKLKQTKKITTEEAEQISVQIIKENKDGSADAVVKFNKKGLETLIQWGMVSMLAAAVDAYATKTKRTTK